MRVSSIMKSKSGPVEMIAPDGVVHQAALKLRGKGIGSLIVSSDGQTIEGIISERDVLRGLADHGAIVLDMKVRELMTSEVITCAPDDDVETLMSLMTENRVRHLPVAEDGKLIGIISIGDVVKQRLTALRAEAEAMRSYITSSG